MGSGSGGKYNPGAVTDVFNLGHESYVKGSGGTCRNRFDGSIVKKDDGSDYTKEECLNEMVSTGSTLWPDPDDSTIMIAPPDIHRYRWRSSDRVRGNINKPDIDRPLNIAKDFCELDTTSPVPTCKYNSGLLEQDPEGRYNPRATKAASINTGSPLEEWETYLQRYGFHRGRLVF